jgi:IS5 family transposase
MDTMLLHRLKAERHKRESSPRFRKLVKWRTGCEGRVVQVKRCWGWDRTLKDVIGGTRS